MVKIIKDKRRANAAKKIPMASPVWVEAFMIVLLAKVGGKVSLSLEKLKAFTGVQGGAATQLEYDEETKVVTLKLHEKISFKGKKTNVLTLEKRIIL